MSIMCVSLKSWISVLECTIFGIVYKTFQTWHWIWLWWLKQKDLSRFLKYPCVMNPCTSSSFILDLYKSSWENNFATFSSSFQTLMSVSHALLNWTCFLFFVCFSVCDLRSLLFYLYKVCRPVSFNVDLAVRSVSEYNGFYGVFESTTVDEFLSHHWFSSE